jgi:DMSO/TMAO reductase YedYZ molybdopterin-dependent catalytic subunit
VSFERPRSIDRRDFMQTTLASFWALGSSLARAGGQDLPSGGRFIGTIPFIAAQRGGAQLDRISGRGLDGRLFTDLEPLRPDALVTPAERFFVRTAASSPLQSSIALSLAGLVAKPRTLTVNQLHEMNGPTGTHLLECAGNTDAAGFGLISAAEWEGVPLMPLIEGADASRAAPFVLISGVDDSTTPTRTSVAGASWIFSRDDLARSKAFLALRMNGAPLPPNHGAPVRLVVPGWYGCACIKWVNRVELVGDSAEATTQMREYAGRTHQRDQPRLARDYIPATIDTAAMPVRVERWVREGGRTAYRVVGIIWGGTRPTNALMIRFKHSENWMRVSDCPLPASTTTWSMWSHWWMPDTPGRYDIVLKIDDPSIRARRLDLFFYVRSVEIDTV